MTPAPARHGIEGEIESFVKTAVDLFLAGPGAEAAHSVTAPYVKVPARVLQDRLEPEEEPDAGEPAARASLDPLQFLAGIPAAATGSSPPARAGAGAVALPDRRRVRHRQDRAGAPGHRATPRAIR